MLPAAMWSRIALFCTLIWLCNGQSNKSTVTINNNNNVKPKAKDSVIFYIKPLKSIATTLREMRDSDVQSKIQRKKYGGKHLRVTAIYEEVVVNYYYFENESYYEYQPGVAMSLLRHVSNKYDLRFTITGYNSLSYGEKPKNGNWTGAVGLLLRNETDVILGGFPMDYERSKVIDYSAPILHSETALFMRAPSRDQSSPFVIVTRPFSGQVWLLISTSIVASGLLLKGLTHYMRDRGEIHYSWTTAIWVFYSIFVQQSLPATPKSWTCRTVLAVWWLGVLTLLAWFTGNMVAIFSVGNEKIPIQSADEFIRRVESEDYKIVTVEYFSTIINSLRKAKSGPERDLYRLMNMKGRWINVSSAEDGSAMVKNNPKLILVGPKDWLEVYAIGDCNVTVVNFGFQPVIYSLGFQKKSPFTKLFTDEIKRLFEEGFLAEWVYQYKATLQRNYSECDGKSRSSSKGKAISLAYAQGVFWLTAVGCLTALGVLVVELIVQKLMAQLIGRLWKPQRLQSTPASDKSSARSSSRHSRNSPMNEENRRSARLRRLSRPLPDLVQFESRSKGRRSQSFSVEF